MYIHRRQNLLNRRKLYLLKYHKELREEQSLMASHNSKRLEDMIASLLTPHRVLFRQNV